MAHGLCWLTNQDHVAPSGNLDPSRGGVLFEERKVMVYKHAKTWEDTGMEGVIVDEHLHGN